MRAHANSFATRRRSFYTEYSVPDGECVQQILRQFDELALRWIRNISLSAGIQIAKHRVPASNVNVPLARGHAENTAKNFCLGVHLLLMYGIRFRQAGP